LTRSLLLLFLLGLSGLAAIARSELEAGQGLSGEYTADRLWGHDVHTRIDRQITTAAIDAAWKDSPPTKFSVRWSGFVMAGRTDWYVFATKSDDVSKVTIDGFLVLQNTGNDTKTGRVRLTAGPHPIVVEHAQFDARYRMELLWARENAWPVGWLGRDVERSLSRVPAWALWTVPPSLWRMQAARIVDPIPMLALAAFVGLALWTVWQRKWLSRIALPRPDWALLLILAFGAYFRLQYIELPMAEKHSWRQITNADIARNFSDTSLNILYPRVSWGGAGEPYVGMEFPLLQWTGALFFRWLGVRDVICRAIAVAFSLATIVGLYGLGRCLWDRAVGRGAAFLYAISPSAIFFGRTFLSDTPMVCFSVFGVWGFASYLKTGKRSSMVWGTATAALACMVKIPAVIILAPIAFLGWQAKGRAVVRDRAVLGSMAVVLLLTIGWYAHADALFHQTGLGEAIWHPSGGYSPDIMAAAGPTLTVSHWSTLSQLTNPEFYSTMLQRAWTLHLTPVGAIVMIAGLAMFWMPNRLVVDVWFATVLLFVLATAEGNYYHEFHQLPMMLPAALYFGFAARPAFDGAWLRRVTPYGTGIAVSAAVLAAVGVWGVQQSRVVRELFRPDALDRRPIIAGRQLREGTPTDALVITVEYDRYGGNSPILLYHARRHGWSFDAASITPEVIRQLHDRYGARFFVTLISSVLQQQRPEVMKFLETQERLPLQGPADAALFALR
jgi:4-amino-4-deoxy-L-arabinose transferase-like glycosyltransferase